MPTAVANAPPKSRMTTGRVSARGVVRQAGGDDAMSTSSVDEQPVARLIPRLTRIARPRPSRPAQRPPRPAAPTPTSANEAFMTAPPTPESATFESATPAANSTQRSDDQPAARPSDIHPQVPPPVRILHRQVQADRRRSGVGSPAQALELAPQALARPALPAHERDRWAGPRARRAGCGPRSRSRRRRPRHATRSAA